MGNLVEAQGPDRVEEAWELAKVLQEEEQAMRRRWIHHTRPDRPLSLQEAIELSARMSAAGQ
jgi:hypothetical protein